MRFLPHFRRIALDINATEGPNSSPGGQGIFNPGGSQSPTQLATIPPNFSGGNKPCSLDAQDLIEFLDVRSPAFFPSPSYGFVCLPTTPQDEAWEVFQVNTYYRLTDPTITTILNAITRVYLIARGQAPPTGLDDTKFFQQRFTSQPPNAGFPSACVMIGKIEDYTTMANEQPAQTGIVGQMPQGLRSFIIPPGYTLMAWNGDSGAGNPALNYFMGMRVMVKRSKTNVQPPIYF